MEISKTRPPHNTVVFSSIFLSIAVCFVSLIHVEIELHAHRQMLRVLNQQKEENMELQKPLHDEALDSMSKMLHSESSEGESAVGWLSCKIV